MTTDATVYETMAAAVARELRDGEVWFTGLATGGTTVQLLARVPVVGMALARLSHAPNSVMLVGGWLANPVLEEIPTGMETEFGTALHFWRSEWRGFSAVITRGEIDVGFGSAAQIDKYGNCNIVCIGDYQRPKVRLIGPINQPAHLSLFGREILVLDHDRRNFVDRVDFVSGVGYLEGPGSREAAGLRRGGPAMILTDKAVFGFDADTKLVRLRSVHPGTALDGVVERTGYQHDWVPASVPATPVPTEEELRLIRREIDPGAILLPR